MLLPREFIRDLAKHISNLDSVLLRWQDVEKQIYISEENMIGQHGEDQRFIEPFDFHDFNDKVKEILQAVDYEIPFTPGQATPEHDVKAMKEALKKVSDLAIDLQTKLETLWCHT